MTPDEAFKRYVNETSGDRVGMFPDKDEVVPSEEILFKTDAGYLFVTKRYSFNRSITGHSAHRLEAKADGKYTSLWCQSCETHLLSWVRDKKPA